MQDSRVERALESHIRRGRGEVDEGSPACAERPEHLLTVPNRAGVAGTNHHHGPPVKIHGDDRYRWRGTEPHDGAELVGSVADEVAVTAEDLPGVGRVPEDWLGKNGGPDGVEAGLERSDHAKIASAASQCPE